MKKLIVVCVVCFPLQAFAGLMVEDFTSSQWQSAIGSGNSSASVGGVTLTSQGGNLTRNNSSGERGGCQSGMATHGLACMGDGAGVGNDEITEGFNVGASTGQSITISFDAAVNIQDVHLLDLFGNEGSGEIAWIALTNNIAGTLTSFAPSPGNGGVGGGYWETGFTANNVTSLTLFSTGDRFSDFAVARVAYSSVPEPGTLGILGAGMLLLGAMRRRPVQ